VHGYKAHIATDEEGDIIRCVEVTTANVHDGTVLEALLPVEPGDVYADSADAARRFTDVFSTEAVGLTWSRPALGAAKRRCSGLQAWNAAVRRVGCRIEKVFGTWKRSYGLRRMRWLGLAKAGLASEAHGRGLQPAPFGDDPQSTGGVMTGGVCPQSQRETSGTASEW
jgi:transposase, IS5 family